VVSEAAASGTPVIGTPNGCLAEIVPLVGTVVPEGSSFTAAQAKEVVAGLPAPAEVRAEALAHWGHVEIARQAVQLYEQVRAGFTWD
jgi:hypothetical protein